MILLDFKEYTQCARGNADLFVTICKSLVYLIVHHAREKELSFKRGLHRCDFTKLKCV